MGHPPHLTSVTRTQLEMGVSVWDKDQELTSSGTFMTSIWMQTAKLCQLLNQRADVAYAEPLYRDQLLYVPSDPDANSTDGAQDYLSLAQEIIGRTREAKA